MADILNDVEKLRAKVEECYIETPNSTKKLQCLLSLEWITLNEFTCLTLKYDMDTYYNFYNLQVQIQKKNDFCGLLAHENEKHIKLDNVCQRV